MTSTHLIAGHKLTLLRSGEEYFPRLIEAIDASLQFVYLETYIFAADSTGSSVSAALKRAVARGVNARILLDGYGSADLQESWLNDLRSAGVEILWFRKEVGRFSWQRYHLRRLHRKLAIVDGQFAFVGGINIEDDVSGGLVAPRLDYAVEIEGGIVNDILVAMQRLWLLVDWTHFHRQGERDKVRQLHFEPAQQQVQFVTRDSLRHRRDIEHAYLKAIAEAKQEIVIANAYFLPGRRFRRALLEKAKVGVRVILLLQGQVEYRLQHYATLALYEDFLNAGVEIHEYQTSYMHAKVAVVDGKWSTIGSSNIDPFSLWLAREANLVIDDDVFSGYLRDDLLKQINNHSRLVLRSGWRKWNVWLWLMMRSSYAITRILTGILGYAKGRDDI
jgi:cardiolipin synthase